MTLTLTLLLLLLIQRATLDPLCASRPSSALVEQHLWPQRAAAAGGRADGGMGGAEVERAAMAAASSSRPARGDKQPLAVRCALPLAAAESCSPGVISSHSPRPGAPLPLGSCPSSGGGGGGGGGDGGKRAGYRYE